jgi:hypothetical protein
MQFEGLIMQFLSCRQCFGARLRGRHIPPRRQHRRAPSPGFATEDIMTSPLYVIAILTLVAIPNAPLLAQENSAEMPTPASRPQPQPTSTPRFAFHRIDGGFLRLDLFTGAIASCSQNGADWSCIPGRDERAVLEGEIARLQRNNAALKNALLEHGVPLPPTLPSASVGGRGEPQPTAPPETLPRPPQTVPPVASAPTPSPRLGEPDRASPDDAEVERIMTVMERVGRRLIEMMVNIQRDLQKKG